MSVGVALVTGGRTGANSAGGGAGSKTEDCVAPVGLRIVQGEVARYCALDRSDSPIGGGAEGQSRPQSEETQTQSPEQRCSSDATPSRAVGGEDGTSSMQHSLNMRPEAPLPGCFGRRCPCCCFWR